MCIRLFITTEYWLAAEGAKTLCSRSRNGWWQEEQTTFMKSWKSTGDELLYSTCPAQGQKPSEVYRNGVSIASSFPFLSSFVLSVSIIVQELNPT